MIDIAYGSGFTLDWTECKHIIEGRSTITFQPSLAHSIFDSQGSLTGEMIDCHFLRLEALYPGRKGATTGKEWLWGGRKSVAKASSGSSNSTLKAS